MPASLAVCEVGLGDTFVKPRLVAAMALLLSLAVQPPRSLNVQHIVDFPGVGVGETHNRSSKAVIL